MRVAEIVTVFDLEPAGSNNDAHETGVNRDRFRSTVDMDEVGDCDDEFSSNVRLSLWWSTAISNVESRLADFDARLSTVKRSASTTAASRAGDGRRWMAATTSRMEFPCRMRRPSCLRSGRFTKLHLPSPDLTTMPRTIVVKA
jgi:hypothetical protein